MPSMPQKRVYPFGEEEIQAASPQSRPDSPSISSLTDADRQALQHVAALLGVSVQSLLPGRSAVTGTLPPRSSPKPSQLPPRSVPSAEQLAPLAALGADVITPDSVPVDSTAPAVSSKDADGRPEGIRQALQHDDVVPLTHPELLDSSVTLSDASNDLEDNNDFQAWKAVNLDEDDPPVDDPWGSDYHPVDWSAAASQPPPPKRSKKTQVAAGEENKPPAAARGLGEVGTKALGFTNPKGTTEQFHLPLPAGSWAELGQNWSDPFPDSMKVVEAPPGPQDFHGPADNNSATLKMVPWNPARGTPTAPQQQRGPYQDLQKREETGLTRKLKACVRCRMQKIRCLTNPNDPTGSCLTCAAVSVSKIHTLACLRYKITECTLYRTGKGPGLALTQRWPKMKLKDITDWAGPDVYTIQVQSDVSPVPLSFTVRKFVPIERDSMKRGWMDGNTKKFMKIEPWAITHMARAMEDMRQYINTNVFASMDFFLQKSDDLVKETYAFAKKHMNRLKDEDEKKLMANFFRLWFAVRRTATSEFIIGDNKLALGIPEASDKSFFLHGEVPLPPVMIHQLDMILTLGILLPLHKQVLEDLQKMFLANKPKSWLTLYLITFMTLHSCASISWENYMNARRQGLKRRYSIPQFISEHHHGSNVFLSHYHYCTKPCDPFKLNWKRRQSTRFANYSPEEMHFLIRTKELVSQRAETIRVNKEQEIYEHELYFVAQMFEDNWSPRDTIIEFDIGTINNVPLKFYYGEPDEEVIQPPNNPPREIAVA